MTRDQWRNHQPSIPYIFQTARIAIDRARGDFQRYAQELRGSPADGREDMSSRALERVEAMAGAHDCDAAAHNLLLAQAVGTPSPAEVATGGWRVALCRDDAGQALAAAQALVAADQDAAAKAPGDLASRVQLKLQTAHLPMLAKARAMSGDIPGGEAAIATTLLDCYLCLRVRGQLAARAGDWPAADRWFAEAVRQAPSLPAAYAEWGEARLRRGDLDGAITKFSSAHDNGPRFADPLKGWGDALARQGRWSAAVEKYDRALVLAPAWQDLSRARAAAARRSWQSVARAPTSASTCSVRG